MSGFVVIRREALDHHIVGDPARFKAWCWLIANACWKPVKFDIKGKSVTLERGQLCASVRQLATAWGWSKSAVERFLVRLETETMIEREARHGRLVLTICNYTKYQDAPNAKRDTSGTQSGTRAGHERDTKEQGNQYSVSKDTGASADPDKAFWDMATAYLGPKSRSMIGKWIKDYTRPRVAEAIAAAQVERAVEPVSYITATLRRKGRHGADDEMTMPC